MLYVEDVSVKDFVSQYGMFLYIYLCVMLECYWKVFDEVLGDYFYLICYVVKVNLNIGVLSVLVKLGLGFDIVLGGELVCVKVVGGDMSKVVFFGVGKILEEIEFVLEEGIYCFNVEFELELYCINEVVGKVGK